MSNKTMHRICVGIMAFIAFMFMLLCMFHLVYAVIWLLVCLLIIAVFAVRDHPMYRSEKHYWSSKLQALRERREQRKLAKNMQNRYQNEFVPDHMLIGLGEHSKTQCLIDNVNFVIGSGAKCQHVLSKRRNITVSGEHCRITYRRHSRAYYIEDLHSLNGTYLGAKRLEPYTPEKLLDNAEISIGHIRYRFVRQAK